MDKQKQIEEIQGLLFCNKWEQPFTDCEENVKCIECIAKQIYNAGYRKIWDKNTLGQFDFATKKLTDQIRKETAEKFAERLKQVKIEFQLNGLEYSQEDIKAAVEGLYKAFMQKVEEIAKEITGDKK